MTGIVFLVPGSVQGNIYGYHTRRAEALVQALRAQGLDVVALRADGDGRFLGELARHALEHDRRVVHTGVFFYELATVATGLDQPVSLFDSLGCTVYATLNDHAFAAFARSRILQAGGKTRFMVGDEDLAPEVRFLREDIETFVNPPPPFEQPLPEVPRTIDLLLPLNLEKPGRGQRLGERAASVLEPFQARLRALLDESPGSVFDSVQAAFEECFGRPLTRSEPDFEVFLQAAHLVDFAVRSERRFAALEGVVAGATGLRIVVTAPPPSGTGDHLPLEFTGYVSTEKLARLMAASRFVLNVSPTYRHDIGARILNATTLGCAVVSDRTPGLDATFRDGRDMLFYDSPDHLGELVSSLRARDAAAINRSARERCRPFSLDAHAARIVAAMRRFGDL